MKQWKMLALIVAGNSVALPALAQSQLGVGGAIGLSQYVYKDYDNLVLPIPMISYESDDFYFRGLSAGYYLFKDKQQRVSLDITYSPRNFDPDDTDNTQLKLLDKRHSTVLFGARYQLRNEYGQVNASFHMDAADETDGGLQANLSYGYPLTLTSQISVTPSVGIDWQNSKFNQYYYGVSQREALTANLSQYEASASVSPYLNLSMNYRVTKSLMTNAAVRYTWLDSEISDSPMAGRDGLFSTFFSVVYQF
ncbi:MipA/OmpV family protein [Shewanella avicenniae]|uniref:MipA/OmpV family protein n=1 Tax=Shewanella avicenniae TaxID=2814294 RepID=A0ABX7QLE3_9GAMM|nr:MipA/OmpV family protein [Shewanella avicenniae]QSX32277.1 MipA/OmpV family protein [Shewanella avicenniae]